MIPTTWDHLWCVLWARRHAEIEVTKQISIKAMLMRSSPLFSIFDWNALLRSDRNCFCSTLHCVSITFYWECYRFVCMQYMSLANDWSRKNYKIQFKFNFKRVCSFNVRWAPLKNIFLLSRQYFLMLLLLLLENLAYLLNRWILIYTSKLVLADRNSLINSNAENNRKHRDSGRLTLVIISNLPKDN